MVKTSTRLRVRYAETDRMGYSYYGNYAIYFEVARVEALRELGISYRALEDQGILLPVVEYTIRFLNPALYDDELVILTTIPQMPSARIRFEYETYRADELLNRASTDLVFVNQSTGRPMRCPKNVAAALSSYF
ncbi:MAG: acyl-CoA thioesterase [Flavobacteriales bacterium]|jgi:acyl-CoA thioester hydrolase